MTACAEADRTVTRLGQVLRQTGIEDIPQLLNVLLGEMSIVGPRMPLLNGFKPGLTGLAQINDAREGFGTTKQHINDDMRYVETWSLLLDIKIILMTLFLRKL